MPGANNDLNVLALSNVFWDLLHGGTPTINFEINGNKYNMRYYLADGIYLSYTTIVKSMKKPNIVKEKVFSNAQESIRKDVKLCFGILHMQFVFICQPGRLWNQDSLSIVLQWCILHIMIVEDEWCKNWPCKYDQIKELP